MKFYTLDTEFSFGKYEGKTVKEIIEIQPTYLDWCAINLDHFYISDEIIEEIQIT
jgi:broad specificity phosphatase PhoE